MMIYDDIFSWEGWGGQLREAAYGENNEHIIPEKYDVVDFTWHEGRAIEPKWRTLKPPLLDVIKEMVEAHMSTE
jgi:hypothetical protein